MITSDDFVLVDRARKGDSVAIERLLATVASDLRTRIERSLSRKTKSFLTSDDVLQETWMEAFLQIKNLDSSGRDGFLAWLTTISRRKICDAVRAQRADKRGGKLKRAPLESLFDVLLTGRSHSTPSRDIRLGESKALLHNLIQLLPKEMGQLIAADLQGLPTGEIAKSMGKTQGAVYMMRSRAHDTLRALVQERISEFRTFL